MVFFKLILEGAAKPRPSLHVVQYILKPCEAKRYEHKDDAIKAKRKLNCSIG